MENGGTSDDEEIHWQFSQFGGNIDPDSDADIISCVQFSHDGEFLATGDNGGRVSIFQRVEREKSKNARRSTKYNDYLCFESHETEFDVLKSIRIGKKINQIKWLKRKSAANFILSTNDKTVKLWKIFEKEKKFADGNWNIVRNDDGSLFVGFSGPLKLPKIVPMEPVVEVSPRRVYANAHIDHINSISVNSDQAIFLSADDLQINIWNLEITNECFNIVDIRPVNREDLAEIITAAEFHPTQCHSFAYSSTKGSVRLCDMRDRALCDIHSKLFEEKDFENGWYLSEIIASVSDVKFSHDGRYLLTRDYLTVKVWDINMEIGPVETYPIHDYLNSKLFRLYENECIFDKFEVDWSWDDNHILTGSYHNFFRSFKRGVGADVAKIYEARFQKSQKRLPTRRVLTLSVDSVNKKYVLTGEAQTDKYIDAYSLDFKKKILHTAWHPEQNIIALAAINGLYIFQEE